MFPKLALFSVRKAIYAITKLPPFSNAFSITGQNKAQLKMTYVSFFKSSICIPLILPYVCCSVVRPVGPFEAPWTVALQVSLSMGLPGKNNGVGYYSLLQGIFLDQ